MRILTIHITDPSVTGEYAAGWAEPCFQYCADTPQVAYKESITKPVDIDSKYAKQSGGRGQYGHCKVKFEPMDVNGEETYKFESRKEVRIHFINNFKIIWDY